MAATRVAVVTGGNKGVGFGIVRALCKQFNGDVILTSRDESRGQAAIQELEKENLKPKYHQLDIEDHQSVVKLADFIKNTYGGLDVLVNNAGIAYKMDSPAPDAEQAEVTTKCNFYATLDACKILFPLLRPHARVCNVSSLASQWGLSTCSDAMKSRFVDPDVTMEELETLITQYVKAAQEGKHVEAGFSKSSYAMSKIGVTVMSIIQQRELDKQGAEDIVVNACCPGYVATDMSSHKGILTIDQGAETPTYCATLPPNIDSPRGKFIREKKIAAWDNIKEVMEAVEMMIKNRKN